MAQSTTDWRQRSASPVRKTATTSFYSPNKKLTNLDYYDYLAESSRKSRQNSPPRGSVSARYNSPSRSTRIEEPLYQTPSKRSGSPSRFTSVKKESPMKGIEEVHLASALKD